MSDLVYISIGDKSNTNFCEDRENCPQEFCIVLVTSYQSDKTNVSICLNYFRKLINYMKEIKKNGDNLEIKAIERGIAQPSIRQKEYSKVFCSDKDKTCPVCEKQVCGRDIISIASTIYVHVECVDEYISKMEKKVYNNIDTAL